MSTVPTIDDIQSDIWHLYHLLDTIVDLQLELPHDGTGTSPLDRVDSLTWVARETARKLAHDTDSVSAAMAREAVRQ
jgi:hypothetical protein